MSSRDRDVKKLKAFSVALVMFPEGFKWDSCEGIIFP